VLMLTLLLDDFSIFPFNDSFLTLHKL
jgi:hypothetical protein